MTPAPSLQLTAHDLDILQALEDARFLTAQQLAWIAWPGTARDRPEKAAHPRLRALRQARLVLAFQPAVHLITPGETGGRAADLYALARAGAAALAYRTGRLPGEVRFEEAATPKWHKLAHTAAIGRCYAAIRARAAATQSVRLSRWMGDHLTPGRFRTIQPDAAFWLGNQKGSTLCFLELDRERPVVTWREKIVAYQALTGSAELHDLYGAETFLLLCVTTTPAFRAKLIQATLDVIHDPSPRYLFSTLDQMTPATAGQWMTLHGTDHPLIR